MKKIFALIAFSFVGYYATAQVEALPASPNMKVKSPEEQLREKEASDKNIQSSTPGQVKTVKKANTLEEKRKMIAQSNSLTPEQKEKAMLELDKQEAIRIEKEKAEAAAKAKAAEEGGTSEVKVETPVPAPGN